MQHPWGWPEQQHEELDGKQPKKEEEEEEDAEEEEEEEGGWALVEAKPHKSNDPSETLSF